MGDFADDLKKFGVAPEEAALIEQAVNLGRSRARRYTDDSQVLRTVERNLYRDKSGGDQFRDWQQILTNELRGTTAEELAFGDQPDWVREQQSAFAWNMHEGHQERYLDRHEDETANDYLNRPGKTTCNVTSLVIKTLSKLYHQPPVREWSETPPPADHVKERLEEIWAQPQFNSTMLELDKRVRLLGTVAVRPIYDPEAIGKVRLWLFNSHELRVICDPDRPWKAAAVIERTRPFSRGAGTLMQVWTDRYHVSLDGSTVDVEAHELGRVPHVFVRDGQTYHAFFREGRARSLCAPNVTLNNGLTDLEEIKSLQGFAVMEAVNPAEDNFRVGPRAVVKFKVANNTTPYGLKFHQPAAPLAELRADCDSQINRILMTNGVPVAALGAEINRRELSGEAIRAALQPLTEDLKEREAQFVPAELDLADSMCRTIAAHEPGFAYQRPGIDPTTLQPSFEVPPELKPDFSVTYTPLSFPESTRDTVLREQHDIAQGMETPPTLMLAKHPERFSTREEANQAWQDNLAEVRAAGFPATDQQPEGAPDPLSMGATDQPQPAPDTLDMLEQAGLVVHHADQRP